MDAPSSSSNHAYDSNRNPTPQPRSPSNGSNRTNLEKSRVETVTTHEPIRRPLSYPESPPLRTRPPSPNLYRLVPVSRQMAPVHLSDDEISESTAESPSPIRPDNLPRSFPPLNIYERSTTLDSREPSLELDERENALQANTTETPAILPPETPFTQLMDTPLPTTQTQTPRPYHSNTVSFGNRGASEPPAERPQFVQPIRRPLSPIDIKTEPSEFTLLTPLPSAPTPVDLKQSDMETSPTAGSSSINSLARPSSNPARRTTRGSLAAAAAAASDPGEPSKRATPEPGAPVQASITTWIITSDKTWLLPQPRLGVSLAQIVPPDVEAPGWMKFTRAPIVWDGKTDAGGKSGRNLVLIGAAAAKVAVNGRLVTPTRSESVDAEPAPTSPDGSNPPLEGLHLLMDYKADEKPSYSYALITRFAILGSPFKSLSLGEIYTMLEAKFPWFARDDSKWRDSIRYNLSSNCWFVKTKRALHQPGVGNLWMVDEESTGGPKRPRKGRGKGSAFMDPDDEDGEDSGDEPGPSIISAVDGMESGASPAASRNGTLMLTFDSKARVPLDRNQGQRGATAHASHNLIPRIVTRQIVMSAVDQAFASPSSNGEPHMDPREKVVQALNNVPFSLSSGDPRDEPRPSKGKNPMTRSAAKEEKKHYHAMNEYSVASANEYPVQNEYSAVPLHTTPAPPWLGGAPTGNGDNGNEEGIGSGKDDEDSLDADAEGLTPEDYWSTEPTSAVAEADPQGPEEYQQRDEMNYSNGDDVRMVDNHVPAPTTVEESRTSAPVDLSALQSLSDTALNENQTRAQIAFAAAKPVELLVKGKELPPAVINGVVVRRRQANYLDPDTLPRINPSTPKKPSAPPPPVRSPTVQAPSFAALWNSAKPPPPPKSAPPSASTSAAGGSQPGRGMFSSGDRQSQTQQGQPSQPPGLRPAPQVPGEEPSNVHPLDRPIGFIKRPAEFPPAASSRKPPQLAKLAPAATSSSGTIIESGRSNAPLQFRVPFAMKTPPMSRRPLTPNPPSGDRPPPSNHVPMCPYAPPLDSRKRKIVPQSPNSSTSRLSSDARQQKVRRIEVDTERRRRVNKINPVFSLGQGSESGPAQASSSSTGQSTLGYPMPPTYGSLFRSSSHSTGSTQGVIGFATSTTNKTYATPGAGGMGSSSSRPSTSKERTGPAFGQSGFMFKEGWSTISPLNVAKLPAGNVFTAFSSQPGPSSRSAVPAPPPPLPAGPASPGQESEDSMDLDEEEILDSPVQHHRTGRLPGNRMEMEPSDEYIRVGARDSATERRGAEAHGGGRTNATGIFAQPNARSSLSISVPVSSSRMDRGLPGSRESMVSPMSESPILPPMAQHVPRGSTQSPNLPSINTLLRQSPAPESRDSLAPIQNQRLVDPTRAQTPQSVTYRPTPPAHSHSRTQSSTSEVREGPSTRSPHASSRYSYYYGFLIARHSGIRAPSRSSPAYSGGNQDDLAPVIHRAIDWRD